MKATYENAHADPDDLGSLAWLMWAQLNALNFANDQTELYNIEVHPSMSDTFGNGRVAFNQCPLSSATEQLDVNINGESINDQVYLRLHSLLNYGKHEKNLRWTKSTIRGDTSGNNLNSFQSQRDIFKIDGKMPDGMGGRVILPIEVNAGVPGGACPFFVFEITEPLFMSPLYVEIGDQSEALGNISTLNIIQRFTSDWIDRIFASKVCMNQGGYDFFSNQANWEGWENKVSSPLNASCLSNPIGWLFTGSNSKYQWWAKIGGVPTSVDSYFPDGRTMKFNSQPHLIMTYMTPHAGYTRTPTQVMPMFKPLDYVTPVFTLTSPESSNHGGPLGISNRQTNLDAIRLSMIPECLYVFTQRSRDSHKVWMSDAHTIITGLEVTFENQNGILSSYRNEDLFGLCIDNGLNKTFDQFNRSQGSVLKLVFGKDIPLPAGVYVGSVGSFSFQLSLTEYFPPYLFTNKNLDWIGHSREVTGPYETSFETFQTFIMPGSFTVEEGKGRAMLGLEPPSAAGSRGSYHKVINHQYYGGGFFGSLWKLAKPLIGTAASAIAPELGSLVTGALGGSHLAKQAGQLATHATQKVAHEFKPSYSGFKRPRY